MVRRVIIGFFLLLSCNILSAQRLNFSLDGGWIISKSTASIYENDPYQILYAAPYSTVSEPFEFSGIENDQVRIARIWGAENDQSGAISLGGRWTYIFKNNFRIGLGVNFYKGKDRLHYSFQNMIVNLDQQEYESVMNSPGQLGEYIDIHRWYNAYDIKLEYDLPIPIISKPFISIGYQYRFQMFSYYDSELTEKDASSYDGVELNEYYNITVFQDRIYRENATTGHNHFFNLGVGIRRYGFNAELSFNYSPMSTSDYFLEQWFMRLSMQYDLFSIKLFK